MINEQKYCRCGHNKLMHGPECFSAFVNPFSKQEHFSMQWFNPCNVEKCECLKYIERATKQSRTKKVEETEIEEI